MKDAGAKTQSKFLIYAPVCPQILKKFQPNSRLKRISTENKTPGIVAVDLLKFCRLPIPSEAFEGLLKSAFDISSDEKNPD